MSASQIRNVVPIGSKFDVSFNMLDSTILLLALASPVSAIAPAERGSIPLVATLRSEPRLASLATLDDTPDGRMSDRMENSVSRWDGSGKLFIGAVGGGALGGALLGGIGYLVGRGLDEADNCGGSGCNIALGAALGAFGGGLAGGIWGAASAVQRLSPEHHPTRSRAPAILGGILGASAGGVVQALVMEDAHPGVRLVPVLIGLSSGAVIVDRVEAEPASVSVVPWSPRPGMQGARLSMAF